MPDYTDTNVSNLIINVLDSEKYDELRTGGELSESQLYLVTDDALNPSTTTPIMDGTASTGSETAYARGDHIHPTDTSRAPVDSPIFTGTPTAPTATAGTSSTQIATTEFVQNAVGSAGGGTVTSVQVQATSPVQSSQNTAQSTSLNTTISLADGYGDTKNPYGSKTANYVLAGPTSGNAAAPTFRALTKADISDLGADVFIAEYGTTTYAQVTQALTDGKIVFAHRTVTGEDVTTNWYLPLILTDSYQYRFGGIYDGNKGVQYYLTSDDVWDNVSQSLSTTDTLTSWYGTSSTTASTAQKAVSCTRYKENTGNILGVLFTTANTAATPTLSINSGTAKSIYVGNSTPNATTNVLKWSANTMVYFMFDGTYYRYITSVSAGSVVPSRGANTWYGTSSTGATTQAKTSTIDNFVLTKGAIVSITFSTANTYTSAKITLNINSTGAKDIYYNGAVTSSTNNLTWAANETVTFIYDGTGYYFVTKTKPILSSSDITTALGYTPYNSSNPSGYTNNTGTVTGVTAGAGLNTTSNDTSTDGGTISSSGTLYLTKSGVTAGTYQGITVDKYGRVTSASDQGYITSSSASNTYVPKSTSAGQGASTGTITNSATDGITMNSNISSYGNGKVEIKGGASPYVKLTASTTNPSLTNTVTITESSTTIKNVSTPSADGDAANKKYVDDQVATKISDPSTKSNGQVLTYNGSNWVADTLPSAPVTSVNTKTGAVTLDYDDVSSIAATSIAPNYSSSSTYSRGALVTYEGQLYECTTAVSTAEAWNSSHWSLVNLKDSRKIFWCKDSEATYSQVYDAVSMGKMVIHYNSIGIDFYDVTVLNPGYYMWGYSSDTYFFGGMPLPDGQCAYAILEADDTWTLGHVQWSDINNLITDYFSTATTYAVGDVVQYEGTIVRCNTAGRQSSGYDNTKWDVVSLKTLIDERIAKSSLPSTSSVLKGDSTNGISAATAGTDYVAPSTTVNGKALSSNITLSASDVGALADTYTAPVTSVNSKTGAVSLTASDVGAVAIAGDTMTGALKVTAPMLASATADGSITIEHGTASKDAMLVARRTDTGTSMGVGIGTGGVNHGVYSHTLGKWMIYGTATNVVVNGNAQNVTGTVAVANGGTGATTLTSGAALIGNGTNAVSTRAITNNTSATAAVSSNTNLITQNTLYYATASINNARQTSSVSVYAPTTGGTANQILVSAGSTSAPTWKATASGAAYATADNGALTFGTLPVAQGGTGKNTWTANYAVITGTTATGAFQQRAITNNTAATTAITASTNLVTMNTLRYALNRTTGPGTADTNYTTSMMRAISATTTDPGVGSTLTSGAIILVYEA